MDEIKGKFKEQMTTQMKRDVNKMAMDYSEKASSLQMGDHPLILSQRFFTTSAA